MPEEYLFVYGTLRKQFSHHQLLQSACEFIDEGYFQGRLYQLGHYPAAIASKTPAEQVTGEVYRIKKPLLPRQLDDYEECSASFSEPHEYYRSQQKILLADGSHLTAWIYLYNRCLDGLKLIQSGDYLNP